MPDVFILTEAHALDAIAMRAYPSHAALRASAHVPSTSRATSSRTTARVTPPVRARSAFRCPRESDASDATTSRDTRHPDTRAALVLWHAGEFTAAEAVLEGYLEQYPHDTKTWISYAQMQKKVRVGEVVTNRLHPGLQSASDVPVSRESVWRSRTVLYRAIRLSGVDENETTVLPARASLLQALGLLELTHGYEMYGSTLLELAVRSCPTLTPVLRWQRIRRARAGHVVAGAGRVQKMREAVRRQFVS